MLAGIAAHEHVRDAGCEPAGLSLLALPHDLAPEVAIAALNGLAGLPPTSEQIVEVAAREGASSQPVVPAADRSSLEAVLGGVIGSLRISEAAPPATDGVTRTLRLFVATPTVMSTDNPAAASRALLTGLGSLRSGEQVVVRWHSEPEPAVPPS